MKKKNEVFFFSRDVNVNMFFPFKRANCTVYDRLFVCVCFWGWGGGGGWGWVSYMVQYGSSMRFELVEQEC